MNKKGAMWTLFAVAALALGVLAFIGLNGIESTGNIVMACQFP